MYNKTPFINRNNKPRHEEKVRQFNGVKGNVVSLGTFNIFKKFEYIIILFFFKFTSLFQGRGLTGLKNLGNTCYMNSIIQCVSNNTAFVIYFCVDHYKIDLHCENKTKGEVAEEMAAVVKTLWSGQFRSIACRDFKVGFTLY